MRRLFCAAAIVLLVASGLWRRPASSQRGQARAAPQALERALQAPPEDGTTAAGSSIEDEWHLERHLTPRQHRDLLVGLCRAGL